MAVPAEIPFGGHVNHAFEAESQFLLPRLDFHFASEWFVFVTSGNVHQDLASRQPALALPVDVGVANIPEPQIAPDVEVPSAQVRVDMGMVTVRSVRNPFG